MGTGMCSRRQKGLLPTALCLLTLACLASGVLLYSHLQQKVRSAEALAQKYKQQQEALSAQLQVVYEHRSRLERSLQKERGEHKKTKEDFLVYKLEAQEALNKEKQDSMNRYGALSSQHKILKNQHDDVKKQLLDLQLQHNSLRLEHRRSLESQSQRAAQLQQQRDSEVTRLQDTVFKLREESKLLRKAHLEVHSQLLSAQAQVEEFRQLKEALQKMPGLRGGGGGGGGGKGQQPLVPASSPLQPGRHKVSQPSQEIQSPSVVPGAQQLPGQGSSSPRGAQPLVPLGQPAPARDASHAVPKDAQPQVARDASHAVPKDAQPQVARDASHAVPKDASWLPGAVPAWPARFTRTVHSLPSPDVKVEMHIQVRSHEQSPAPGPNSPAEKAPEAGGERPAGSRAAPLQSWPQLASPGRARAEPGAARERPGSARGSPRPAGPAGAAGRGDRAERPELRAGVIDRELHSQKEPVVQEPMLPDDAADPAQDPNNQGEDEFEEAELERPDFEEKVGGSEKFKEPSVKEEWKEKPPKDAGRAAQPREDPLEDYQEDQEQEIEDHGGEVDDNDDLELVQEQKESVGRPGAAGKKDDYF
ncbi:Golgi integral membrane protein 4-like isoform X2 [Haemorhous mexicanus]|uniref:Golgi integral membrane protein 4-like isoform X2 n=1 Tax=Haemorhous mexicanus TaxID=30427 RepID=UPI0028BEF10D|nr:Golgi integral membrane protein 4-like isoform X2 [Haemorhous mexicanus]